MTTRDSIGAGTDREYQIGWLASRHGISLDDARRLVAEVGIDVAALDRAALDLKAEFSNEPASHRFEYYDQGEIRIVPAELPSDEAACAEALNSAIDLIGSEDQEEQPWLVRVFRNDGTQLCEIGQAEAAAALKSRGPS